MIAGQRRTGRVKAAPYQRTMFATRYIAADVQLLAYVDKAHGNLSGPATKRIIEREHSEYGQAAYQRLAAISVAHLYRLRSSTVYRKGNPSYQPTRPTPIPIGERRKPQPKGSPGFLRIDTVHPGDLDGRKGLYHINAVDQVMQWEIVAATPQISEYWLLPVLEAMLGQFPFVIRGFHSDNVGEFINYTVARLLEKLPIEQTNYEQIRDQIDSADLPVDASTVLVMLNCGPKGAPRMPEWGHIPIPRALLDRGVGDMLGISDARMSGTSFGTVVVHVAPGSAIGGSLAAVRTGDEIALDVSGRRIDLRVPAEEIGRRLAGFRPAPPHYDRGYGRLFLEHVMQANEGCDFDFLVGL